MSLTDEQSIFTTMKQGGPFAVTDGLALRRHFSREARDWARQFRGDRLMVNGALPGGCTKIFSGRAMPAPTTACSAS